MYDFCLLLFNGHLTTLCLDHTLDYTKPCEIVYYGNKNPIKIFLAAITKKVYGRYDFCDVNQSDENSQFALLVCVANNATSTTTIKQPYYVGKLALIFLIYLA